MTNLRSEILSLPPNPVFFPPLHITSNYSSERILTTIFIYQNWRIQHQNCIPLQHMCNNLIFTLKYWNVLFTVTSMNKDISQRNIKPDKLVWWTWYIHPSTSTITNIWYIINIYFIFTSTLTLQLQILLKYIPECI